MNPVSSSAILGFDNGSAVEDLCDWAGVDDMVIDADGIGDATDGRDAAKDTQTLVQYKGRAVRRDRQTSGREWPVRLVYPEPARAVITA